MRSKVDGIITPAESTMKLIAIVLCALAALAAAEEPIELDYHNNVGVPKAEALKQAELAADFDGTRIVGGSAAALGAYPYMVSFKQEPLPPYYFHLIDCVLSKIKKKPCSHMSHSYEIAVQCLSYLDFVNASTNL